MAIRTSRRKIEDSPLSEENMGKDRTLTSDLPMRSGKKKSKKPRLLFPFLIVILAGVLSFLITGLFQDKDDEVDTSQNTNTGDQTVYTPPVVEEPQYETVIFATVNPNEVGYLNVRAEPSTAGARLGQLDIGDKLEVLDQQEGWVKIQLEEPLGGATEGWVSADYVEITTEQREI
jgi:hypothetical protein